VSKSTRKIEGFPSLQPLIPISGKRLGRSRKDRSKRPPQATVLPQLNPAGYIVGYFRIKSLSA